MAACHKCGCNSGVECLLPKQIVAGSNPATRSIEGSKAKVRHCANKCAGTYNREYGPADKTAGLGRVSDSYPLASTAGPTLSQRMVPADC